MTRFKWVPDEEGQRGLIKDGGSFGMYRSPWFKLEGCLDILLVYDAFERRQRLLDIVGI